MSDSGGEEEEERGYTEPKDATSTVSASSNADEEGEVDVVKRRSKNRVNARRSRERKRLMLDTLQQEHWQLHQENKRIKMDNAKLKEAVEAIKALQSSGGMNSRGGGGPAAGLVRGGPPAVLNFSHNPMNGISVPSVPSNPTGNTGNHAAFPPSTGNPIMDLLAQQMLQQQQQQQQQQQSTAFGGGVVAGVHPMLTQMLLAQAMQGGGLGGFNPATILHPNMGIMQQQQQPAMSNFQGSNSYNSNNTMGAPTPLSGAASGTGGNGPNGVNSSNGNGSRNSANAPNLSGSQPTVASLLQALNNHGGNGGGAQPNNSHNSINTNAATMNLNSYPFLNNSAAAGNGGLASLLQALGAAGLPPPQNIPASTNTVTENTMVQGSNSNSN